MGFRTFWQHERDFSKARQRHRGQQRSRRTLGRRLSCRSLLVEVLEHRQLLSASLGAAGSRNSLALATVTAGAPPAIIISQPSPNELSTLAAVSGLTSRTTDRAISAQANHELPKVTDPTGTGTTAVPTTSQGGAGSTGNTPATTPPGGTVATGNTPATTSQGGAGSTGNTPATTPPGGTVATGNTPATTPPGGTVATGNTPATTSQGGAGSTGNMPATTPPGGAGSTGNTPATTPPGGTVATGNTPATTSQGGTGALPKLSDLSDEGTIATGNMPATTPQGGAGSTGNTPATTPPGGTVATGNTPATTSQGGTGALPKLSDLSDEGTIATGNMPATTPPGGAGSTGNTPATTSQGGIGSTGNTPATTPQGGAGSTGNTPATTSQGGTGALPKLSDLSDEGTIATGNMPATTPQGGTVATGNTPATTSQGGAGSTGNTPATTSQGPIAATASALPKLSDPSDEGTGTTGNTPTTMSQGGTGSTGEVGKSLDALPKLSDLSDEGTGTTRNTPTTTLQEAANESLNHLSPSQDSVQEYSTISSTDCGTWESLLGNQGTDSGPTPGITMPGITGQKEESLCEALPSGRFTAPSPLSLPSRTPVTEQLAPAATNRIFATFCQKPEQFLAGTDATFVQSIKSGDPLAHKSLAVPTGPEKSDPLPAESELGQRIVAAGWEHRRALAVSAALFGGLAMAVTTVFQKKGQTESPGDQAVRCASSFAKIS